MNKVTKTKLTQWAWFAGLWCIGLMATAALSYTIRWMVRAG